MKLPTQRFTPPTGSEDDYNFDDDHGHEEVLSRDITVEVDDVEYVVDLERESIEDRWYAVSTDAPLECARAAFEAAETEANG